MLRARYPERADSTTPPIPCQGRKNADDRHRRSATVPLVHYGVRLRCAVPPLKIQLFDLSGNLKPDEIASHWMLIL